MSHLTTVALQSFVLMWNDKHQNQYGGPILSVSAMPMLTVALHRSRKPHPIPVTDKIILTSEMELH